MLCTNKFRPSMTTKLQISTFHCNCRYISQHNEYLPYIIAGNFKTFHISTVRISTFHCNCPNICQLNFDIPDIITGKL